MGTGWRIPILNATILLILSALVWPCFGKNSTLFCRDEEQDALLELKRSLTCTPPDLLRSWQGKEDCCNWKGVGCDPKSGHVIKLELLPLSDHPSLDSESKPYSATELSPSLLKLRSLSHLDLSGFNFKFSIDDQVAIPEFLGSMKQLRFLNLSGVYFSGSYHHLGNLTSLEVLDLQWAGSTIDEWISRMACLEYLDMTGCSTQARNAMQAFGTLPSLSYLSLSNCGLNNSDLPYARGSNTSFSSSLSHVDLSGNDFDGTIPGMFQNMSSLRYLDLSNNQFDSFESPYWSSPNIQYLDMSRNCFQGQLPSALQNMTSLTFLGLAYNQYSSVPSWFVNLKSLVNLDLSSNSLEISEGGFMLLVREKCELRFLNLDYAQFEGEMTAGNSSWFCASSLESFTASHNYFQGKLPDWLGNLKGLKSLKLDENLFTGPIPDSWVTLPSLTELDISLNRLHGPIPEGLGQLRSLESLQLQGNRLTGVIPEGLGQLRSLKSLQLQGNRLNGVIPESLGQLQALEHLNLSGNSLEGAVSQVHFANLSKLDYLDLCDNRLVIRVAYDWKPPFKLSEIHMGSCNFGTPLPQWLQSQDSTSIWNLSNANIVGELPEWFGDLAQNISEGDFSRNNISGPIPFSPKFSGNLDLSYNQISGPLPNFSALIGSLDLSYNQISGPLPNFSALIGSLGLSHNQISGPVPDFSALTGALDLSYNQISGPVPNFSALTGDLDLSHNQISGPIPNQSNYGSSLDLSHNMISGTIPANIGHSYIGYLYLDDNLITGTMPTSLCDAESLEELDLSRNELSGSIPDYWGYGSSEFLDFINLSSNNLSGLIPRSFRNITSLTSLHLSDNNLHGDLPEALRYSFDLKVLDIGGNNIDGEIPSWIGNDNPSLRILRLRDNQFHGRIPPGLCLLADLHVLDLAINNLEGTIPDCFGNMSGMTQVASPDPNPVHGRSPGLGFWGHDRMVEVLKGRDLEYTTNLQLVVALDLSSNNLVGPIPEELTHLEGLLGLNLSHNCLSGEIPEKIGDMKFLESLDLSNNQLSGTISPSLSDLSMLSDLNLSNNNFSGRIPRGKQLDTLYEPGSSIYAGNPLLCGEPLTKKCPSEEAPATPETKKTSSEGSESVEKAIFYGVTATGFMTGFWGVFGVLVFKKKWRIAYFRLAEEIGDRAYVAVAVKVAQLKRKIRST